MDLILISIIVVLAAIFIWNLVGIFVDQTLAPKSNEPDPSAEKFIEGIFSEAERRK